MYFVVSANLYPGTKTLRFVDDSGSVVCQCGAPSTFLLEDMDTTIQTEYTLTDFISLLHHSMILCGVNDEIPIVSDEVYMLYKTLKYLGSETIKYPVEGMCEEQFIRGTYSDGAILVHNKITSKPIKYFVGNYIVDLARRNALNKYIGNDGTLVLSTWSYGYLSRVRYKILNKDLFYERLAKALYLKGDEKHVFYSNRS